MDNVARVWQTWQDMDVKASRLDEGHLLGQCRFQLAVNQDIDMKVKPKPRVRLTSVIVIILVACIIVSSFVYTSVSGLARAQLDMQPPGSALPSDKVCAARIAPSTWEPRPDNHAANNNAPTRQQVASLKVWNPSIGLSDQSGTLGRRVTGDYTGTTAQILQWVACKWGIDPDLVRAQALQESDWEQSMRGDWTTNPTECPPGTWNGTGCYQSYGILQMKYSSMPSAWPMSRDATAFNADFTYGWIRNCYEGWTTYLNDRQPLPGYPKYHAGDIWGCVGYWYSGTWYDKLAIDYIQRVKARYEKQEWLWVWF